MTDARRTDSIRIQNACPKKWGELVGSDAKRYCDACDLHVHNSEALTRVEAEALVREADERVCMRIVSDETGAPVFRDSRASLARRAANWALATGAGLLAACKEQPPEATGIVAPPAPSGGPTTSLIGDAVGPEDLAILGEVCVPEEELGKVVAQPVTPPEEPLRPQLEVMGRIAAPQTPPADDPTPPDDRR